MKNKIIHGDCLNVMQSIPSGSVDMILCDLPYGTTACKWDAVIPFAPLWEQYNRVCSGVVVLTASQPFTTDLINSNRKNFKYEWIWKKTKASNYQLAKHNPMKIHENILVFYRKKRYYPQMEYVGIKDKRKTFTQLKAKFCHIASGYVSSHSKDNGYRYPKSVIEIGNSDTTEIVHNTQKPVALFEYLVRTYTNEGDMVLDNCIGSGTTAIACINTNRNYIGIEKEEKFCEIARERIGQAKKGNSDNIQNNTQQQQVENLPQIELDL